MGVWNIKLRQGVGACWLVVVKPDCALSLGNNRVGSAKQVSADATLILVSEFCGPNVALRDVYQ